MKRKVALRETQRAYVHALSDSGSHIREKERRAGRTPKRFATAEHLRCCSLHEAFPSIPPNPGAEAGNDIGELRLGTRKSPLKLKLATIKTRIHPHHGQSSRHTLWVLIRRTGGPAQGPPCRKVRRQGAVAYHLCLFLLSSYSSTQCRQWTPSPARRRV